MSSINKILLVILFITILYSTSEADFSNNGTYKSPINLRTYSILNNNETSLYPKIRYPAHARFEINETVYQPISNRKFTLDTDNSDFLYSEATSSDNCGVSMDGENIGQVYVRVYNYSVYYNTKKIYLKFYSEHAIENTKSDLEIQIMHELDPSSFYKLQTLREKSYSNCKSIEGNYCDELIDIDDYKYLGISIRFSSNRDKTSKDKFIKQIVNYGYIGKYDFTYVQFADINQFFKKPYRYYHYQGSGTTPNTKNTVVQWILLDQVQDMDQEEFRSVLNAVIGGTGCTFGNARNFYVPSDENYEQVSVNYLIKKKDDK